MADLTLPEVITRFRGNEARIADFTNGNAAGYYITVDGKKVETLPSVVSRLAAAIAAASATRNDLAASGGAKLIGFGAVTVDAALTAQAKGIADNAKAIADLDKAKLAKDGGTMTGPLTLAGAPTDALHAATKGWAEGLIGTYWKPVVGDLLTTVRGAPDATWIPDGANYLQASYPDLFAKLGLLEADGTGGSWTGTGSSLGTDGQLLFGKDGVIVGTVGNSAGAIRRSTDNGSTFTEVLTLSNPVSVLETDKAGVWIAGGSGGTFRSTDNGLTWTSIATTLPGTLRCLCTDRKGVWIAGINTSSWVMKSKDHGVTWTKIAISVPAYSIATNRAGIWMIGSGNVGIGFRSTDNGDTWAQIAIGSGLPGSVNLTNVAFGAGVFVNNTWFTSGQTSFVAWTASVDGLNNWSSYIQIVSSQPVTCTAIDDRGLGWAVAYTGTHFKLTAGVNAAANATLSVTAINNGAGPGVVTWPTWVATDGNYTWLSRSGSGGALARSNPLYDVKTLFRVPKSAAQPAPFATFVKAK